MIDVDQTFRVINLFVFEVVGMGIIKVLMILFDSGII